MARLRKRRSLREANAALAGDELSPWVFPAPSDASKAMNRAFLRYKVWYRILRDAGLCATWLHDPRHTYVVLFLQVREPVPYVSQLLGQSSMEVAVLPPRRKYTRPMTYTNRDPTEVRGPAESGA
jgi:integrase